MFITDLQCLFVTPLWTHMLYLLSSSVVFFLSPFTSSFFFLSTYIYFSTFVYNKNLPFEHDHIFSASFSHRTHTRSGPAALLERLYRLLALRGQVFSCLDGTAHFRFTVLGLHTIERRPFSSPIAQFWVPFTCYPQSFPNLEPTLTPLIVISLFSKILVANIGLWSMFAVYLWWSYSFIPFVPLWSFFQYIWQKMLLFGICECYLANVFQNNKVDA